MQLSVSLNVTNYPRLGVILQNGIQLQYSLRKHRSERVIILFKASNVIDPPQICQLTLRQHNILLRGQK